MVETISQNSTLLNEFDYITSVDTNVAILQTTICIIALPIGFFLIYGIVLYHLWTWRCWFPKTKHFQPTHICNFHNFGFQCMFQWIDCDCLNHHQVLDMTFRTLDGIDCLNHQVISLKFLFNANVGYHDLQELMYATTQLDFEIDGWLLGHFTPNHKRFKVGKWNRQLNKRRRQKYTLIYDERTSELRALGA